MVILNKRMYYMIGKYYIQYIDNIRLNTLKAAAFTDLAALKAEYVYAAEPIPFEKRMENNKPISVGDIWCNESYGCGWFHFTGKVPKEGEGKKVVLMIDVQGEGCEYDKEGNPICGLTCISSFSSKFHLFRGKKLIKVADLSEGNEDIDIWVEVGSNCLENSTHKEVKLKAAKIVVQRDDVSAFFYDYLTLSMLKPSYILFSKKFNSIQRALNESFCVGKTLKPEDLERARGIIAREFENGEDIEARAYATGHAHLDLAWLWPLRETKRKAERTFTNQLRNTEKYPGYIFGMSQPQQVQWMEERHPKLFKELQRAVEDGRVEPQGGMWVECDTNITGGESLIRQCLYGKTYWKEKFNRDVNFGWLPDCFGFNGNLPQILKKCGMDYFLTIKISWNKQTVFPRRSFIWEGIDGSKVLVHMPPENNYNSDATPMAIKGSYLCYPDKDKTDVFSVLFGCGDGGGGPGDGNIELIKRQNAIKDFPKVEMATASKMFSELEKDKSKLLTIKGELYLETHQGTYTTQSNNKNLNRRIEFKLHNVEFLATVAGKFGYLYPKEKLEAIWKEVLLYQFHDIIPGSSIKRVYTESVQRYKEMLAELEKIEKEIFELMRGEKGIYAVNGNSFPVREVVKYAGKQYLAEVPPYGGAKCLPYVCKAELSAGDDFIESPLYRVEFDERGYVRRLFDKQNNKELVGKFMNELRVYRDKPREYDAWNIDWKYMNGRASIFKLTSRRSYVENGCAVMESNYSLNKSTITQRVVLSEVKEIIDFQTEINWQETHKMLRAEFKPTVFADEVSCDIQMGVLKRTTKNVTKQERAQFEICAHKWIDVSDKDYGLSILSASKYGWRAKNGLLSLNLLRSPMWPAKDADKGTHLINYALYPHKGDLSECDTVALAYSYNNPLTVLDYELNLPSFAESKVKNVVIETIKKSENGEGTIIRAYENSGKETIAEIVVQGNGEAYICDMLERNPLPVSLKELQFSPYEIKTLLIK